MSATAPERFKGEDDWTDEGEDKVESKDRWEEKGCYCEQNGSQQQAIKLVGRRFDPLAHNVVFLT